MAGERERLLAERVQAMANLSACNVQRSRAERAGIPVSGLLSDALERWRERVRRCDDDLWALDFGAVIRGSARQVETATRYRALSGRNALRVLERKYR